MLKYTGQRLITEVVATPYGEITIDYNTGEVKGLAKDKEKELAHVKDFVYEEEKTAPKTAPKTASKTASKTTTKTTAKSTAKKDEEK